MAVVRPYLFERCFDLGAAVNAQAAEPAGVRAAAAAAVPAKLPAKLYDDADLERVRAEARAAALAEGTAAGRAEARAEAEASDRQRQLRAAEAVAKALERLARGAERAQAAAERDGIAVALAVARKVLAESCRRHAATEIEGVLHQVLDQLRDEPRLIVRVAAADGDALRAHLQPVVTAAGFAGTFAVVGDATIAGGDCRIEWSSGGVERDSAALWRRIDDLVARALTDGAAAPAADAADTTTTTNTTTSD